MAVFTDRWPENIPGKFYVDSQCTDCDLCRETAPEVFKRSDDGGYSYVYRQPETDEEIEKALEALEGCPCESIGADGDKNNWSSPVRVPEKPRYYMCKIGEPVSEVTTPDPKPVPPKSVRPWWKFWA